MLPSIRRLHPSLLKIPGKHGRSGRILHVRRGVVACGLLVAFVLGCGDEAADSRKSPERKPAMPAAAATKPSVNRSAPPDDLPLALVLGLSAFAVRAPGAEGPPVPLPAELEFIARRGGKWVKTSMTDPDSNVFHKALAYTTPDGSTALLTGGGSKAMLKLWKKQDGKLVAQTLWEKDFGGRFSRIRDIEVGDIDGDGTNVIAVATHDQGVVAVIRPRDGGYVVEQLDSEKDTFVHEIELGDMDGDGAIEIYATPSEPNRLDGSTQSGRVVRYRPSLGEGRVVVADLGERHAKEILVHDFDGDSKDELYVVVEGQKNTEGAGLTQQTEIWRYGPNTPPDQGVVIAELDDLLGRFLTPSDLDGDGQEEIVVALFKKGVWWLRPGPDPTQPWHKQAIDRRSSSFEHAAIATDLDGDGLQELYVASDNDKALRRYVWNGMRLVREEIYKRTDNRSVLTWNIMPIPLELVPD